MAEINAIDLLVIDELTLAPMTREEFRDLYRLFVERTGRAATVVTSNRDTAEWLTRRPRPWWAGGWWCGAGGSRASSWSRCWSATASWPAPWWAPPEARGVGDQAAGRRFRRCSTSTRSTGSPRWLIPW